MLVSIVITTYDSGNGVRTKIAESTIRGLLENLNYPELHWIIADDGSDYDAHVVPLLNLLAGQSVETSIVPRLGVGASKNRALEKAFAKSPIVLLLEDDWLLTRPFNFGQYVNLLERNDTIGMVRLGYLGGEITATYEGDALLSYWRLKRGSGVYIYSGQISLRHERFYKAAGYHAEGVSPGEEELEFCKRFNGVEGCPDIIWPAPIACQFNEGLFVNIGMNDSLNQIEPTL